VELVRAAGLLPIGIFTEDTAIRVVGADEMPMQLKLSGYDHFA